MKITKLEFAGALNAIKNETRPIEGHDDPGAIQDCWATVFEFIEQEFKTHSPDCNIMQDWSEVDDALATTPTQFRDESWNQAVEEINTKRATCTCGLNDVLQKLSNKQPLAG